jgi:hypothetical protein
LSTPLPKDAILVELRPDTLTFRSREGFLRGTVIDLVLRLEGQPLALQAPVDSCIVAEKERSSYVFHCRLDLTALPEYCASFTNASATSWSQTTRKTSDNAFFGGTGVPAGGDNSAG